MKVSTTCKFASRLVKDGYTRCWSCHLGHAKWCVGGTKAS